MKIQEFSRQTGLSAKTIRYYESIGILPAPQRTPNGYREYEEQHLERARFVAGTRSLELSLDEISELLAMQDQRKAPCRTMLNLITDLSLKLKRLSRISHFCLSLLPVFHPKM